MRRIIFIQILFFFFCDALVAQITTINLNQNWEFRKFGDTTGWMKATVPGTVHPDLINQEIIADPFFGDNEKSVEWVAREDWQYRTTFSVSKKTLDYDHVELHFEGLDTYAAISLNGEYLRTTENMFVEYDFDIKNLLKKKNNTLEITFYSAVNRSETLAKNSSTVYPPDARVWSRKAQYQFGWDWGPKLVTAGIWKPATIRAWNNGRITSLFLQTVQANADSARFFVEYEYELDTDEHIQLQLTNLTTGEIIKTNYQSEKKYRGRIYQTIKNPALWWCNGYGEQPLYTFELKISRGKKILDKKIIRGGIRTIELVNNNSGNGEFYFKLNGQSVFMKGANMIPMNSFPSSVTKNDYRKLLNEAVAMHMNMLRLWGGGIYEADDFYELCDSLGIMVWQDFMYSGAMYPLNELNYNKTITDEAVQQIRRLRGHPCIAIWCGNNEVFEGWDNWGWQEQFNYTEEEKYKIYANNSDWFDVNFLSELEAHAGDRFNYIPSSPEYGWGHLESLSKGDCHYWGVWWGNQPFEMYNERIPRFMSEYGFQGMPSLFSFQQFIPTKDLIGNADEILSGSSVKNHQKHPVGYETIRNYMGWYYKVPEKFDDYIYVSQLLQAKGMQTAIEAHRRNMPYCMGTLFWQLNDCWPVTSWSVVDYYGNRKAAYYAVKKSYNDVMISAIAENDSINIYVVNDKKLPLIGSLVVSVLTTNGVQLRNDNIPVNMLPHESAIIFKTPMNAISVRYDTASTYIYSFFVADGKNIADNYFYFVPPKNLKLNSPDIHVSIISYEIEPGKLGKKIVVTSNKLVKNFYLYSDSGELNLSDNFFDFSGSQSVIIEGEVPEVSEIRFKCLNDIQSN